MHVPTFQLDVLALDSLPIGIELLIISILIHGLQEHFCYTNFSNVIFVGLICET